MLTARRTYDGGQVAVDEVAVLEARDEVEAAARLVAVQRQFLAHAR